jgi:VWFA-related protein
MECKLLRCCLALTLAGLIALPSAGRAEDEDDVRFEAAVEIVEVDVQVLDKSGSFVSGLKREDFEVLEEGKRVEIVDFEERHLVPASGARATTAAAGVRGVPARRFILFVDLFNTGIDSLELTKRYLRQLVSEVLAPSDEVMVTILTPDRRTLVLVPFTSERAQLMKAIDVMRGNPSANSREKSVEQDIHGMLYQTLSGDSNRGSDGASLAAIYSGIQNAANLAKSFAAEETRRVQLSLDSLAAVIERVDTAGWQPGRKTVVYVAEALPIRPGQMLVDIINQRITEYNYLVETGSSQQQGNPGRMFPVKVDADLRSAVRTTVGRLNRFGATLYTVDARGIFQDAASDPSRPRSNLSAGQQQAAFFEGQEALNALAVDTGGLAFYNQSNLSSAMQRIEQDNRSRYFLTYRAPTHKKGKKARFYEIQVKVNRPEASTVRARKGYLD